jgi:hypothetical protein
VPVMERQGEPAPRPVMKVETKIQPLANSPDTLTPPMSPTQVTLSKAPTPWMQKQSKLPEELPEWAKRTGGANPGQEGSSSGASSPSFHESPTAPRQIVIVNAPRQQQQQQQQQQQSESYPFA